MKKTIMIILAAMLLIVSLASAFSGSGSGIDGDPYQITNCTQLQEAGNALSSYYVLMNDIDCVGVTFIPVGTISVYFTGSLDGRNYVINNLVTDTGSLNTGLFGAIGSPAIIRNVRLENVNMLFASRTSTGGLAGTILSGGEVTNCSTSGILSSSGYLGGLVGLNYGIITRSYSSAIINVSSSNAGGLVGFNYGIINNTYATGNLIGTVSVNRGGLSGFNFAGATISNSYSTGQMTSAYHAQCFLGVNSGTVTNSYNDNQTCTGTGGAGSTRKITTDMKTNSTFMNAGWDFVNTWQMCPEINNGYPSLRGFGLCPCTIDSDCGFCEECWEGSCEYQLSSDMKGDCGFCEWCDGAGSCEFAADGTDIKEETDFCQICDGTGNNRLQNQSEDYKNECSSGPVTGCINGYTYAQNTGFCNNNNGCADSALVTEGNVCVDSTDYDVNPSAAAFCDIWSDCLLHNITAPEYYAGYDVGAYIGDCIATDWQSAGTYQNATPGYWWDLTQQTGTCTEETIPCVNDSDCGFCEYCSVGTCIYQDSGNDVKSNCPACQYCDGSGSCMVEPDYGDLKDACSPTFDCAGYDTNYFHRQQDGNCMQGFCRSSGWFPGPEINVSDGNICILSTDYDINPTIDDYCAIWKDCVSGRTTAPEYVTGYCSGTCCDTDWIAIGTNWTAPTGYRINVSEHANNCSIQRIPSGGGGSIVGAYEPIIEARAAESTTSQGLSNQQKGALVIGIGALGIIAFKSGLLGKGAGSIRRRRK
jgi:hypothetical protein